MSRTKKQAERFTPGPWRVGDYGVVFGANDEMVCDTMITDTFPKIFDHYLIACAPEMYDLLKRIKGMLQFCELEDKIDADTEHEIGALLARARGEGWK